MGRIVFTEEGLKRKTLLEPGWYLLEITEVAESEAKDKSTNYVIDFKVVDDNPNFNGVPIRVWLNEKFPEYWASFPEAFLDGQKVVAGKAYEITRDLIGKQLLGNVTRGEYNKKPTNQIDDYAPKGAPLR